MRSRISLFLLSLLVCLGASAAAPVVTFESDGVYATVPAGHRVAWSAAVYYAGAVGFQADSDNDGRVKLAVALYPSWIVVDIDTGEWTTGGVTESSLPPRTIVPGPTGAYSTFYADGADRGGAPLWVRPGVGAWKLPAVGYGGVGATFYVGGVIVDATKMKPVGTSPATPASFERGDVLFLLNPGSANTGIVDAQFDDAPSPGTIAMTSIVSYTSEGSSINVDVVRLHGTAGTVSVRSTVSGSAEAGIDYPVTEPAEIVFGPGETVKPITLPTLKDGAYNLFSRSIVLTLSDVSGGATLGARTSASTTLLDQDAAPVLAFGDVPASVIEGDTPWTLDVPFSVTGAFRGTLPVSLGTASFPVTSPQTQQVAKLPIVANDVPDPTLTLTLMLSSSANNVRPVTRTLDVLDDDPPRVVVDDASGSESSGHVSIAFRTEARPGGEGTVYWTLTDGTAKAGEDYVSPASGSVKLSRDYPAAGVSVEVIDDNLAEQPEVFYLDITSVSGPLLPPVRTRIALTIIDNDTAPPAVTVAPISVVEGNVRKDVPLRVQLASPATSIIELRFDATGNGTATRYQDFYPPSFLFFYPGESSKDAMVRIYGDTDGEPDETGEIAVMDKNWNVIATTTITIVDDDMATTPVVSFSATPPLEGDSGEKLVPVHVQLATPLPIPVTVALSTSDGTATTADYTPLFTTVTFQAGETDKEVFLAILGDVLDEQDETVILTAMRNGEVLATLTLKVLDDDSASFASIADTAVVEETGSSVLATFRVTLSPPPKTGGTVQYATATDTAGAADFDAASGTVGFSAGQTEMQLPSVEVFGDGITEPDERFVMRLSNANGVTLLDDRAYATIYDDDVPVVRPTVAIADVDVRESSDWTEATFTLRLSAATETVKLSFETADGSASAGADYEHRSGVVTFVPGETTRTVVVRIAGDAIHEETETFTLWLSNGDGVMLPDLRAICTIADDDPKEDDRRRRRSARH